MKLSNIRFYIKNYGCQMNTYDSERLRDLLMEQGAEQAYDLRETDIVILNTCFIREKAEEKIFSDLGRIRPFKDYALSGGQDFFIIVMGCAAKSRGELIVKRAPYVDIVIGPRDVHHALDAIYQLQDTPFDERKSLVFVDTEDNAKFDVFTKRIYTKDVSAFLTIQEGCNNFCSYCVVPYTRGKELSRPVEDVVEEVRRFVENGSKEVVLFGQNVNSYRGTMHGKKSNLGVLLFEIAEKVPNLKRLRYLTSHPKDVHEDLLRAHRDIDILAVSTHMPLQAGSDDVLHAMRRGYTLAEYMAAMDKLKAARDDIAISSDFIVGFPGETEEDFQKTIDAVYQVGYAHGYSFKYSIRPNTKAGVMPNQIEKSVKEERLDRLQDALKDVQLRYNQQFLGKELRVLILKEGKRVGEMMGRSQYYQYVNVIGDVDVGEEVLVRIDEVTAFNMRGVRV